MTIFWVFLVIFTLISPVIAIIAIVQWVASVSRQAQNGGLNEYQRGYRDGMASAKSVSGNSTDQADLTPKEQPVYVPQPTGFIDVSSPQQIYSQDSYDSPSSDADEEAVSDYFVPQSQPILELSPEQKSRRSLNVLLSLGSLLFVAAGIAFVASDVSDATKLIGIYMVVALFYLGGHMLHARAEALRPAAVAFIGTGLALVPTLGVALSAYTNIEPSMSWLITSIIGVVAYLYTALKLQSQVVAYLSIAFSLSLFASGVGVVEAHVFWYFVVMIATSIAMSLIATWRPNLVPQLFRAPLETSSAVLAPLSVVAMFFVPSLEILHYEIMFGLLTMQYLLVWLRSRDHAVLQVVRVLASLTLSIVAWDLSNGVSTTFGVWLIVISTLQVLLSFGLVNFQENSERQTETAWVWTMFALQFLVPISWIGSVHAAAMATVTYAFIAIFGLIAIYMFKKPDFGYISIAASLVLVPVVVYELCDLSVGTPWVALSYVVLALLTWALVYFAQNRLNNLKQFVLVSFVVYTVASTVAMLFVASTSATALALSLILVFAWLGVSWVAESPYSSVLVSIPLLYVGFRLSHVLGLDATMSNYTLFAFGAIAAYALFGVLWYAHDRLRRNIMLAIGHALVLMFAVSAVSVAGTNNDITLYTLATTVVLLGSIGSLVGAIRLRWSSPHLYVLLMTFGLVYLVFGLITTLMFMSDWWQITALGYAFVVSYGLAWKMRWPWMIGIGSFMLFGLLAILLPMTWLGSQYTAVTSLTMVAAWNYILCLLTADQQVEYREMALMSTWVAVVAGYIAGVSQDSTQLLASGLLGAGALTMYHEGIRKNQPGLKEVAIYEILLAISTASAYILPELNYVYYAHIWALGVMLTHLLFRSAGGYRYTRLIVGMSILSLFGGVAALDMGGWYSLIFLAEHVVVLLVGAQHGKMWAVWWGIIASTLGVLYYLKDTPFLAFTLLGIVVVSFVIWRLKRQ